MTTEQTAKFKVISSNTSDSGVKVEVKAGEVELTRVYANTFQKEGTLTAEVKQTRVTNSSYPGKKVSSNLQQGLVDFNEFEFESKDYSTPETRVAWLLVPFKAEGAEREALVSSLINNLGKHNKTGACIYRMIANHPILDDNQKYALTQKDANGNPLKTMDDFADSQVIRYSATHETMPNQLILDKNGNVQYKRTFFWQTQKDDMDLRGHADFPPYQSAKISAELIGAQSLVGQTI